MYQQVYHHKATRAADASGTSRCSFACERADSSKEAPPDPLLPAFRAAALGESISVEDYLRMDDAELLTCLSAWEHGRDATLAELQQVASASRRLPKTVPLPDQRPDLWEAALQRAREAVAARRSGETPFACGSTSPRTYPYREPCDGSVDGLWVTLRHQPLARLGDASFLLGQLRNKRIERPRLIFPEEFRPRVLDGTSGCPRVTGRAQTGDLR